MMTRRTFVCGLTLGMLAAPLAAKAQQAEKVYRIGWLTPATGPTPRVQSFIHGLREHGYVEGQHFVMEYRRAAGKSELLPVLAADLVRAKVDVIVAAGTAQYVKPATQTIPIVFVAAFPVESGLVTSLARPGSNLTGVATNQVGHDKNLQLLKEIAPGTSRVAFFYTRSAADKFATTFLSRLEADGRALNVKLEPVPLRDLGDVERALSGLGRSGTNGLLVDSSSITLGVRERFCELAMKQKLPAMGRAREFADSGCLVSYGENLEEVYRRAAYYVHKIFMGAKPADLPVEQLTKFELVINLKTAKALGLTIPQSLLLRADQVIQ